MKIERVSPKQVNIRMVRLTETSKKSLTGVRYFGEPVDSAIECGDWWIPSDSYLYSKLRDNLEKRLRHFFNIPSDRKLEVKSFESDILEFDDGIHPDYT